MVVGAFARQLPRRTPNVLRPSAVAARLYSSHSAQETAERTRRLLDAKDSAGLSYDELASRLGVTNTYAARLLLGQARLGPDTAARLRECLPAASAEDVDAMVRLHPMRGFDAEILKEPNVYRTYEAVTHYGEAIKSIINEQCGDGISETDFSSEGFEAWSP